MSIPFSAIAATTAGFNDSPGAVPAEWTMTRPPPRRRVKPAAIWDRPALWTQRYRTSGFRYGVTYSPSSRLELVKFPWGVRIQRENGEVADRATHEFRREIE